MRKILLVSGCSYTHKDWCSDFHDIGPNAWPFWPEILGKKLDMEVINLAQSGAGNEYIYFSLLDKIATIDNIGLVIPAWSVCQRRDWKIKGKWFNNTPICNTGKLSADFLVMVQMICMLIWIEVLDIIIVFKRYVNLKRYL